MHVSTTVHLLCTQLRSHQAIFSPISLECMRLCAYAYSLTPIQWSVTVNWTYLAVSFGCTFTIRLCWADIPCACVWTLLSGLNNKSTDITTYEWTKSDSQLRPIALSLTPEIVDVQSLAFDKTDTARRWLVKTDLRPQNRQYRQVRMLIWESYIPPETQLLLRGFAELVLTDAWIATRRTASLMHKLLITLSILPS